MSPRKLGVACVAEFDGAGVHTNPWTLAQRTATLEDLQPAWWHNFEPSSEGTPVLSGGGYFVPMLVDVTDHTPTKIATAVANAQGGWIMSLGEAEGHGWTVQQGIDAWGALVNDSSILARPDIKLVSPYTVADGSVAGSWFQLWLAGITSAGYRLPDAIALDKYAASASVVADWSTIATRINAYKTAFPTYNFWIPEFGILQPGDLTDPVVLGFMDQASRAMDSDPRILRYAWWYMGPPNFLGAHGNDYATSNQQLYDNSANVRTIGTHWKTCGRFI